MDRVAARTKIKVQRFHPSDDTLRLDATEIASPFCRPLDPTRAFQASLDMASTTAASAKTPGGIPAPRVVILMACRDGEKHLPEQLDSISRQSFEHWLLVASDDGSTDATRAILEGFRDQVGADRVVIREGPRQGFQKNFLLLACDPQLRGDYYAFSDQDDVWEPDKLKKAVSVLSSLPPEAPVVYGSRTQLIDPSGKPIGYSPLFSRPPSFRNALVQNIAGGNTMVFNEPARRVLAAWGSDVQIPTHDWWLYLLIMGAGGVVHYDPWPSVRYRQHGLNVIGGQTGWWARLRRVGGMLRGQHRAWNTMHCRALMTHLELLTPANRQLFAWFRESRGPSLPQRISAARKARIYRQSWLGNAGLVASVVLKRL